MSDRQGTSPRRAATGLQRRLRLAGAGCAAAAAVVATLVTVNSPLSGLPTAGAAPKPTPTISGAPDYKTGYNWFDKNLSEPYKSMDAALRTFAGGISVGDVDTIQQGCDKLAAAGREYQGVLPGPSNRANARLSSMVGELDQAVSDCRGLGPGAGWKDSEPMMSHVNTARAQLRSVQQILAPYN